MGRNRIFIAFLMILVLAGCAKRGTITGGAKDTISPVLKVSFPKNYSTGFTGKEIQLTFDEYVKLKDIGKQLIVSPPMKIPIEITPMTASKTITIRIKDTLAANTTYSFNFGQSIQDNNEGNPYPQFKYVFSTGNYIDSLALQGIVKDAFEPKPESFISVMLYDVDENFNDSIVFNQTPRYVTNTLDSLRSFKLENLKAGKYLLVAMKDRNANNKFNPKTEKIAFHKEWVTVPNDTLYEMELFSEEMPFKAFKPVQVSNNKLLMGYEGNPKSLSATVKRQGQPLETILTKVREQDSVHLWYKPLKVDSLQVSVSHDSRYAADFSVKIKTQKNDTLVFSSRQKGTLGFRDDFVILPSRPLSEIDNSRITLLKKDSTAVPVATAYDPYLMELKVKFEKEPLENYVLTVLPGALTDFLEAKNDTLSYKFSTKNTSDYGNLKLTLSNIRKFPIIVELTDPKGETVASHYEERSNVIDFVALEPMRYTLRIIYDENANRTWDTGNYLEKRQPEEVIYYPTAIDVRANWDVDQAFTLP
jgi:uncharacterized protein (DUF2141 family)